MGACTGIERINDRKDKSSGAKENVEEQKVEEEWKVRGLEVPSGNDIFDVTEHYVSFPFASSSGVVRGLLLVLK